ncbi:right-handed parallel beta-helix repeat-containing protein [Prosthecobacter sp.]|uniref:right-handed parallel beta-helix repeat-containing protein n=1 Tax=Prosthecobacter sp. TaxID=1965333 RepID=UPI00248821AA|nr:right-handed parallel beta-helix repeat-containing protein [Prosthecobacter sp.]MDI1312752.1 right-handed parallel beta-helix repeat-containing protein [Prosthecobacter sp.]
MKPISILTLLCLFVIQGGALAQGASPAETAFGLQVPAPGADALADDVLQQAIDKVSSAGGGTVILGAGAFKLSRKAGDETVIIKSNVTLRGQGYATHIYLDPKTPPHPIRYFPMRIGSAKVPANNVVIENLRYTGNDKLIGGGSIMGFNARLDEPESMLLSCDNITVRNCWIYDSKQAAGCTKPASNMYQAKYVIPAEEAKVASKAGAGKQFYGLPERQASQFKNWQVHHNMIDTCGNKAVELAECNGGLIADNYIINCEDGPQVIFGSRNVRICDNQVFFLRTGINITEGSHHITVTGNIVEPVAGKATNRWGTCLLFRTEPLPLVTTVSHVSVTGNVFRNQTAAAKLTVSFETRPESLGCKYEAITLTGNVLDGDVQLYDRRIPMMTTISDIVVADNVCEGKLTNVPAADMKSSHITIRGNTFRSPGNQLLKASGWIWSDNTHTSGTLELDAAAKGNIVRNNVTTSPIHDQGIKTSLNGNEVFSPDP